MRGAKQKKGIFCIEGNWVKDLRTPQTVRPVLNLLLYNAGIPYIKRFLQTTRALALCGYRTDVPWMRSTAFELLLLHEMQNNEFSGRGIDAIARKLHEHKRAFRDLEFRIVTVKDL